MKENEPNNNSVSFLWHGNNETGFIVTVHTIKRGMTKDDKKGALIMC